MKRLLLVGVALATLTLPALGQQNQITGNECWTASQGTGTGGPAPICVSQVRGLPNVVTSTVTASFTIGSPIANGGVLIITAQPLAATITMPPPPLTDGATIGICNGTNSAFSANVVTVAANTTQTMVPTGAAVTLTTLAANTCVRYLWNQGSTSWFKVQ